MVITQIPYLPECPDCGDRNMREELVTYEIPYGADPYEVVHLKVTHHADVCQRPSCGHFISDWRGEMARTRAVKEHLEHLLANPKRLHESKYPKPLLEREVLRLAKELEAYYVEFGTTI